jgi:predicted enzyme related to lactoylglutathione lyase
MAEQATAKQESPAHGTICWTELTTKDAEAARNFYSELLGWTMSKSEAGGVDYTEFQVEGRSIGGIFQMTAEFGEAPSHWMSYVAVADVDATARRVEELGGKLYMPPRDIPKVGRFCIINDPTGATIALITLRRP